LSTTTLFVASTLVMELEGAAAFAWLLTKLSSSSHSRR
jgi:hypothetical protein